MSRPCRLSGVGGRLRVAGGRGLGCWGAPRSSVRARSCGGSHEPLTPAPLTASAMGIVPLLGHRMGWPIQAGDSSRVFQEGPRSPGKMAWQPSGRLSRRPVWRTASFLVDQTEDAARPPPRSTLLLILRQNLLNAVQRQSIRCAQRVSPPSSKQNAFRRS